MQATPSTLRVVEALFVKYRRTWKFSMVTSVINPVFFLLGMGLGLGAIVDKAQGTSSSALDGVAYLPFLAPGLLAATAVQVAGIESTFPIMEKIRWAKTYEAMLSTPLAVRDLVVGQLTWIALRLIETSTIFFLVMLLFGAVESPLAVLAIPAAVLTGMAMAAPICAYAATRENDYAMSTVLRFVIMPMFLFSGTFFPVSQLPSGIRPIAYITPLWHGVDLCRSLALDNAEVGAVIGHVVFLGALIAVGCALAAMAFRRRLVL
jgi:lipooligosaccharide transport system permease protein